MKNSPIKYIEAYSGFNFRKFIKNFPNSISAQKYNAPTFIELIHKVSFKSINGFMVSWISICEEIIKIKGKDKLNENDIFIIQMTICNNYRHLKISEIAFIFCEIARGKYGPFYNLWNAAYIIQSFSSYTENKVPYLKSCNSKNKISMPTKERAQCIVLLLKKRGFEFSTIYNKHKSERRVSNQSFTPKLSEIESNYSPTT